MWSSLRLAVVTAVAFCASACPAAADTTYGGTTSQSAGRYGEQRLPSNHLSFSRSARHVRGFSIPWVATCASDGPEPALLERTLIVDPLPVINGRFAAEGTYEFRPGPRQEAQISPFELKGRIRGEEASGTLKVYAPISGAGGLGGALCEAELRWSATAGRRVGHLGWPTGQRPASRAPGLLVWNREDRATGTTQIWMTSTAGRHQVPVTFPPAGASDAAPSLQDDPIRPLLAYQRAGEDGAQIRVGDPYGPSFVPPTVLGDGRITAFPQGAHRPSVASDGRIAFSVGSGDDCSIWVAERDGGGQRQLTDHAGQAGCDDAPVWSPGSDRIAFRRTLTGSSGAGSVQHMVVNATGGTPSALTLEGASPVTFSWAPGPKIVLLTAGTASAPSLLQVVDPDGGGLRTVLRAPGLEGRPAWSPTGGDIAVARRGADGTTDIVTVRAAGGTPFNVTETPEVSEDGPSWGRPPMIYQGQASSSGVHARSHRPRKHGKRPRPSAR